MSGTRTDRLGETTGRQSSPAAPVLVTSRPRCGWPAGTASRSPSAAAVTSFPGTRRARAAFTAGPGVNWAQVADATAPHGLAAVGGHVSRSAWSG